MAAVGAEAGWHRPNRGRRGGRGLGTQLDTHWGGHDFTQPDTHHGGHDFTQLDTHHGGHDSSNQPNQRSTMVEMASPPNWTLTGMDMTLTPNWTLVVVDTTSPNPTKDPP
ncbi:hypothetical protein TURU_094034 [Turdus rufiventris]|nr:hypothetical protein TURU_094034 [Turdus rufiventris]